MTFYNPVAQERGALFIAVVLQVVEQLVTLGSSLVVIRLISGILGVEDYGILQFQLSVIAIFNAFATVCGAEVVLPVLSRDSVRCRRLHFVAQFFFIRGTTSLLVYLAYAVFCLMSDNEFVGKFGLVLGIGIALQEPLGLALVWYQAELRSYVKSIIAIAANLLRVGVLAFLWMWGVEDRAPYLIVYSLGFFLTPLIAFVWAFRSDLGAFLKVSLDEVKRLLPASMIFMLASVMQLAFLRMDRLILVDRLNFTLVGNYNAAMQLVDIANSLVLAIVSIILPLLYRKRSTIEFVSLGMKFMFILLILIILGCVVVSTFSDYIAGLAFGSEFNLVARYLGVQIWLCCFYCVAVFTNSYLVLRGKYGAAGVKWASVGFACFLALDMIGWRFGVLGVTFVFMFGFVFAIVFDSYYILRELRDER